MIRDANSSLALCVCLLLTSLASVAQSPAGTNQQASVLPAWAVLVLKPVGADRVRPITGVVISGQGLILVPFDFAAPGDQIIVLDGGTDIVADGRAATVKQQIPEAGLTVLSAPALKRRPASLSAAPLANGDEVRLAAFPPAELIAQGAAPVSVVTEMRLANAADPDGGRAMVISTAKALPNVTGPLLDRCGNLVGFSSADGVQSMDTTRAPSYLWRDDLLRVLQRLPLDVTRSPCPPGVAASSEEPAPAGEPEKADRPQADQAADVGQPATADNVEPLILAKDPPPAAARMNRLLWLGVLAVALLAGLFWLILRGRATSAARGESPDRGQAIASEPVPPARNSKDSAPQPDCVLEINGRLPDGAPFISSCDVHGAAIDIVIGRGRADISIDSEHVHREHVRLSGSADMLTISDLGSTRGTWINRVPCLKGEIMFVGPDDTIFLGDVSLQVTVRPRQDRARDT